MAHNYVGGVGDGANVFNDGEAFAVEIPGGTFNYGAVVSATTNTMTVAAVTPLASPAVEYGALSIAITSGRGLGQVKEVVSLDTNQALLTLAGAFAVVPDATSKFTLYAPLSYFTVYSNTLVNCAKGIWGFGNQNDTVVADNTSIDCNGVFIWSARAGPPDTTSSAQDCPDYFNRITRNTVRGVSRRSKQGGIGTYTGRFDSPKFYDVEVFNTEIVDNDVSANNAVAPGGGTESPPYDGIYLSSYPFSTGSDGTGTGDTTLTIIESNRLSNLPTGITLTRTDYGQFMNANSCDSSVLTFLSDTTTPADNTVAATNSLRSGSMKPVLRAQPQGKTVLTNGTPTFTAPADGLPAPVYQWFKNGQPITGAAGASYTSPPVLLADSGAQFSVVVSNSAGSTASSNALLTVVSGWTAPVILAPPQNQLSSAGRTATFSIVAQGVPPPIFQWQTNAVDVPGAMSSHFTTRVLTTGDAGTVVRCLVANAAGSVYSQTALLDVADPTPGFASPVMAGGAPQLELDGSAGRAYIIQASADFRAWAHRAIGPSQQFHPALQRSAGRRAAVPILSRRVDAVTAPPAALGRVPTGAGGLFRGVSYLGDMTSPRRLDTLLATP